jgi:hypothetical protein
MKFPNRRLLVNYNVLDHSLPEWHRDKALGQLVEMGVIHPNGGANAVAGWWLCYRDEFAPVGTTSTIDAKNDIALLLIIARSALSPGRNKQLNPHVDSESGFIRFNSALPESIHKPNCNAVILDQIALK